MDGARFANALVACGVSPADMTWRAGIDALSFGATKNGALACEAVVFFDPARAANFAYRRKRGGQTLSKGRFLGAQMEAYLKDGLWLRLAERANGAARPAQQRLADDVAAAGLADRSQRGVRRRAEYHRAGVADPRGAIARMEHTVPGSG